MTEFSEVEMQRLIHAVYPRQNPSPDRNHVCVITPQGTCVGTCIEEDTTVEVD